MGLASAGENGVKALMKSRYRAAGRTYTTLGDVRKAVKVERTAVAAALDGNVLMMQVPQNAATFAAYTGIVTNAIRAAMGSAGVTVVVFDDPAHMTNAKREEQARRDTQRKKTEPMCSVDIVPYPTSDSYGVPELTATTDCHAIVKCRASRQRFFDETGRMVLLNLKKSIANWAQEGAQSVVLFDGLDPRGALRPFGEPRVAQIFGSCDATAALFQREQPMGEGDLKLAWVEQRVRELTAQGKLPTKLHMTITIDTDSIAIELMEQARRNCEPLGGQDVMGVLCMRERSPKRDAWEDDPGAVYWAVDYNNLLELIVKDMWKVPPAAPAQRMGIALMCAGWALAGCDFCKVAGLRADMVMDALPGYLNTAKELTPLMANSWSGDRDAAKNIEPALRRLVMLCAGNYADQPRSRKATAENMRQHDRLALLRAAWVTAYWSNVEFCGDLSDFGFTAIYDGQFKYNAEPLKPEPAAKKPRKQPAAPVEPAALEEPVALEEPDPQQERVVSKYFAQNGIGTDRSQEWFASFACASGSR